MYAKNGVKYPRSHLSYAKNTGKMLNTPPPPKIELCQAPVFQPCMVLHKTMQHGSTRSFYSAKELSNVLSILYEQYVLKQLTGFEFRTFKV